MEPDLQAPALRDFGLNVAQDAWLTRDGACTAIGSGGTAARARRALWTRGPGVTLGARTAVGSCDSSCSSGTRGTCRSLRTERARQALDAGVKSRDVV